MSPQALHLSPHRLKEQQHSLEAFRAEYTLYVAAYLRSAPGVQQRRARVTALIPAAHWAIRSAGMDVWIAPPPMLGGPAKHGLSNCAFAHEVLPELPLPTGGIPESCRTVLDVVEQSTGFLRELEKDVTEARRRPTYWADRVLRAVLGFPAYLIGLVSGKPTAEVEHSKAGGPLRFLGAAGAVATIAGTGHAFGWW